MNYMSPEALSPPECDNEFKLSRKSDIWSLGCILYQLVRSAMFEFGPELRKISWRGRVCTTGLRQNSFPPHPEHDGKDTCDH